MNSRGYDWEAIRRDYPLEAIVAKSIKLRSSGATKVACCPFHTEKTPSFHVYPDNSYHCFGCGAHGDVIDFVAGIEHIEPAEAIRTHGDQFAAEVLAGSLQEGAPADPEGLHTVSDEELGLRIWFRRAT